MLTIGVIVMSRLFTLRYEPSGCLYIAGMVNVDNLAEREGLKGEASVDESSLVVTHAACALCQTAVEYAEGGWGKPVYAS